MFWEIWKTLDWKKGGGAILNAHTKMVLAQLYFFLWNWQTLVSFRKRIQKTGSTDWKHSSWKITFTPHRVPPLSLLASCWHRCHCFHGGRFAAAIAAVSAATVSTAIATIFWFIDVSPCTSSASTTVACPRCWCCWLKMPLQLSPQPQTAAPCSFCRNRCLCFYHCFYHCTSCWCSKYYLDKVIYWTSLSWSPAPSTTTDASVSTAVCCWLYFHCRHSLFPMQWHAPCEILLLGDVQNITSKPSLIN